MAELAREQFLRRLPLLLLLLLVVSLILQMVCMISSRWYTGANGEAGLWKLCTFTPPKCHHDVQHLNGRQGFSAALMVIALGSLLMATTCSVLHHFKQKLDKYLKLQILGLFLAAASILLAIILWGSSVGKLQETLGGDVSLGWTFFFTITVGLITVVGGFLAVLAFCFKDLATPQDSMQGTSNQSQPSGEENPPPYSDLNITELQAGQTPQNQQSGPGRSSTLRDIEGKSLNVRNREQDPSGQTETITDEQNKVDSKDKAINSAEKSLGEAGKAGVIDTKGEKLNTYVRTAEVSLKDKPEGSANKCGIASDSATGEEPTENVNEEFLHLENSKHGTNRDMASTLGNDAAHNKENEDDETEIHGATIRRPENTMASDVETTAHDTTIDSGPVTVNDFNKQNKMGMEAPQESQQDSTTNVTGENRRDKEEVYDETWAACEPEHVTGASN